MNYNLALPFYESSVKTPGEMALFVAEQQFSYAELAALARRIAGWLQRSPGEGSGRVGLLASRSPETYAGLLATLWVGAAYVPINPQTPEDRLIRILE